MLRSLHVRNLAVLAGGDVELAAGLIVLTGETGAGKSLVVDSLALLAGARASADLIRDGVDGLTVAGVFALDDAARDVVAGAGIDLEGDELVVRREVTREGRNRVFLNDQPATLKLLQDLAPRLLRIHGQRDEQLLQSAELQRSWLDRAGGDEAARLLDEVASRFDLLRAATERLERLTGDVRLREERLDLLRFQADEIDAARLAAGEEEILRSERDVLRHGEAIRRGLGGAYAALFEDDGAVAERLAAARNLLDEIAAWERSAAAALPELAELLARVEDLARTVQARLDGIEADPRRLDEIEDRLAHLERLFRKYGASSVEVLARRETIGRELAELEEGATNREELEATVAAALAGYRESALGLSARRRDWGEKLARRVEKELSELALPKAKLAVELERDRRAGSPLAIDGVPVEFGARGLDRVTYLFAPNPGEPLRPLAKIASGGELSRVALALQLASRGDEAAGEPVLIFDEVDAGIGGAESAALGRKLQRLARRGQLLVVTHLAQVASFADRHYKVSKRVRGGRTFADVAPLDRDARVVEVARMLSGESVTALSLSHAEEMLTGAEKGA